MNYKDKYFYIPSVHAIVYVHDEDNGWLTLGANSKYVSDAKSNTNRQAIQAIDFEVLEPRKIELPIYENTFLEKHPLGYRVRKRKNDTSAHVLPFAIEENCIRAAQTILPPMFQHR